jgi:hypothetical protein
VKAPLVLAHRLTKITSPMTQNTSETHCIDFLPAPKPRGDKQKKENKFTVQFLYQKPTEE